MAIDFPNSPSNGDTFTVGSTVWQYASATSQWKILAQSGGLLSGSGQPEGSVTGTPGQLYADTALGRVWQKSTGTGNTGWAPVDGHGGLLLPTAVYIYAPYQTSSNALASNDGECTFQPFYFPHAATISGLEIDVQVAGSTNSVVRLGVFRMNTSLLPGTLISDAGTVTTTSGTQNREIGSLSIVIPTAGWYFLAAAAQGNPSPNQPSLRRMAGFASPPLNTQSGTATLSNAAQQSYVATVTGAFASNPTISISTVNPVRVGFKISSAP